MTLSYSDEDIVEIMVDIPDDDLESEEHKLEVLQEVKDEIAETGGVNYDLAITLETLMEGCISKQMPLRSFTKQHSLTNYNVAIEGIDKVTKYVKENILDKVVEAIKKLIQWLASLFARSGNSSDKPQKEKIAESVKNATRNDTRQKNEAKREQDIAKRISRVDALSKTLVESIQKDMEGNAEFNSSGSDVEKTFMDIRKFYATVGLRGKFSPFIHRLTVQHDGSDLANATKLMTILTEHISLVLIEINALSKAIDNNQEFPPRQGFMPYERYNTILKSFKNVNFNEAENKGLPTVTEFKKGLYEYIKLDDTIKVVNFDDVTWHGAASYFEGASQRTGEKFIGQVLHVNSIITKIQTKLKAEKDDATVGLYLPAVEMIKDEIAYITHVSSIIDLLEVACGNFANAYNKKVIDASRYFTQIFALRLKKMEGVDNELKDRIFEYINAKDDEKTEALEAILVSLNYAYIHQCSNGIYNTESIASDIINQAAKKLATTISTLINKIADWNNIVWKKTIVNTKDIKVTVDKVDENRKYLDQADSIDKQVVKVAKAVADDKFSNDDEATAKRILELYGIDGDVKDSSKLIDKMDIYDQLHSRMANYTLWTLLTSNGKLKKGVVKSHLTQAEKMSDALGEIVKEVGELAKNFNDSTHVSDFLKKMDRLIINEVLVMGNAISAPKINTLDEFISTMRDWILPAMSEYMEKHDPKAPSVKHVGDGYASSEQIDISPERLRNEIEPDLKELLLALNSTKVQQTNDAKEALEVLKSTINTDNSSIVLGVIRVIVMYITKITRLYGIVSDYGNLATAYFNKLLQIQERRIKAIKLLTDNEELLKT